MHPPDEPLFSSQRAAAKQEYWARWEYSLEDWERSDRLDWASAQRTFWLQVAILLLLAVVILIVLAIIFNRVMQGLTPQEAANAFTFEIFLTGLFIVLLACIGGSLIFLWGWPPLQEARKRHIARQSGSHRITIGNISAFSQSLWLAGQHFPLQSASITLTRVKLTYAPLALHLRRKHGRPATRTSGWSDTMRILLPPGHEQEASQLFRRFQQETILSSKRKDVPAEPL